MVPPMLPPAGLTRLVAPSPPPSVRPIVLLMEVLLVVPIAPGPTAGLAPAHVKNSDQGSAKSRLSQPAVHSTMPACSVAVHPREVRRVRNTSVRLQSRWADTSHRTLCDVDAVWGQNGWQP